MLELFGLAIPYNRCSKPFSANVKERFLPGAFTRSIESRANIFLLWNHEMKYVLVRTSNGSLKLREDHEGVHFENDALDNISWVKDLISSIRRGDVEQISFLFRPSEDKTSLSREGEARVFNYAKANLFEISVVTEAMFPQSYIAVRGV